MDKRVTPSERVTSPTWGSPPPYKQALNQMLNLRRIFDCFSRRFDKVVFNLKLLNLVDSDVPSKQLPLELD